MGHQGLNMIISPRLRPGRGESFRRQRRQSKLCLAGSGSGSGSGADVTVLESHCQLPLRTVRLLLLQEEPADSTLK